MASKVASDRSPVSRPLAGWLTECRIHFSRCSTNSRTSGSASICSAWLALAGFAAALADQVV